MTTLESLRSKRNTIRPLGRLSTGAHRELGMMREKMFRDIRGSHDSAAFMYGGHWCYPRLYDASVHHELTYCECDQCEFARRENLDGYDVLSDPFTYTGEELELMESRGDEGPRYYYDDDFESEE
jgi:hypothetical protein